MCRRCEPGDLKNINTNNKTDKKKKIPAHTVDVALVVYFSTSFVDWWLKEIQWRNSAPLWSHGFHTTGTSLLSESISFKKITNKVRERVKYRREQDRRLISEEENVYICPQTWMKFCCWINHRSFVTSGCSDVWFRVLSKSQLTFIGGENWNRKHAENTRNTPISLFNPNTLKLMMHRHIYA